MVSFPYKAGIAVTRFILLDEFHIRISVAAGLPDSIYDGMRRRLDARRFQASLRKMIRQLFQRHPPLRKARATLTR